MHSKISSLAAVAAVAALVTPALAVDDHLVPVPADVVPEVAAATTGADAKDAALPTGPPIPFPEINGFPKPPAPGYQNGKADTTSTTTPTTYTTWCPDPTVITWGKLTTSVTTKGYITLTDCELNTTTTTTPYTTPKPVIPTDHPHPQPYPKPEQHDGEHGDKHDEEHDGKSPETTAYPPIKPPPTPPHTVTPAPPTKTPVIVSGASKTQGGIFIGVAVAAVSFAVFGL